MYSVVKSGAKVRLRFGTEAGRFKVVPSFSAFILDFTSGYRYLLQQNVTTLRYHRASLEHMLCEPSLAISETRLCHVY